MDRQALALYLDRTEQVRESAVARCAHGGNREERAQRLFELLGGLRRAAGDDEAVAGLLDLFGEELAADVDEVIYPM